MAVSGTGELLESAYRPWHTMERGADTGVVGVVAVNAEVTGAAGGGTATIHVKAPRNLFGFPYALVPTFLSTSDNLATAEVVSVSIRAGGNRLLSTSLTQAVLPVVSSGPSNIAVFEHLAVPIEPDQEVSTSIIQALWDTNTDTKVYHVHAFFLVFDLQLIARKGRIPDLLAGLR